MKLLDIAVLSAAAFAAYKLSSESATVESLKGEYDLKIQPKRAANRNAYKLDDCLFRYLEDPAQTVLLQCFAHDYTAPRMIADENLYNSAVAAANKTGAPCGWVQIVAIMRPRDNLENAAEKMLKFCDDFIMKNKDGINLAQLRNNAITSAVS